jgi:hypothetical protein
MPLRFSFLVDSSLMLMVDPESLSLSELLLLLGGDGFRLLFFFFFGLGWLLSELSEGGVLDLRLRFLARPLSFLSAFLALLPCCRFFLLRDLLVQQNRMS